MQSFSQSSSDLKSYYQRRMISREKHREKHRTNETVRVSYGRDVMPPLGFFIMEQTTDHCDTCEKWLTSKICKSASAEKNTRSIASWCRKLRVYNLKTVSRLRSYHFQLVLDTVVHNDFPIYRVSVKYLYNFKNLLQRQTKRQTSGNCHKIGRTYLNFFIHR